MNCALCGAGGTCRQLVDVSRCPARRSTTRFLQQILSLSLQKTSGYDCYSKMQSIAVLKAYLCATILRDTSLALLKSPPPHLRGSRDLW